MTASPSDELVLYTYWRSSAAYRVRIALNLKGLAYRAVPVNLVRDGGEQHGEAFRALNPQALVPALAHEGRVLTQSLAICEYLEERFDAMPLLRGTACERARTRSLALQVACDIHPLNNLRVQQWLGSTAGPAVDLQAWMNHWMSLGFEAIEAQLASSGHPSADGQPDLFDCFLVPQVYNAERFKVDLSAFPRMAARAAECRRQEAFRQAAPENQPDAVDN